MAADPLLDQTGEDLAIHGERAATRHPRAVGALEQHGSEQAELRLEQSMRVDEFDALEGVAADEFGEAVGLVGGGADHRAHFDEGDRDAALGEGPGRFRAGQPPAEDGHGHFDAAFVAVRRPPFLRGPEARRAASNSMASAAVRDAGSLPRGREALTSPCLT